MRHPPPFAHDLRQTHWQLMWFPLTFNFLNSFAQSGGCLPSASLDPEVHAERGWNRRGPQPTGLNRIMHPPSWIPAQQSNDAGLPRENPSLLGDKRLPRSESFEGPFWHTWCRQNSTEQLATKIGKHHHGMCVYYIPLAMTSWWRKYVYKCMPKDWRNCHKLPSIFLVFIGITVIPCHT